jgi:hypothetical protein
MNGGVLEKTMRFFNLLEEDDGIVLSISNCAVYTTLILAVVCLVYKPQFFIDVLGAYGVAKANYAYKRWVNIPSSPRCEKDGKVGDDSKSGDPS